MNALLSQQTPQLPSIHCSFLHISNISFFFASRFSLTQSITSGNLYTSPLPHIHTFNSTRSSHHTLLFNALALFLRPGTSWKQPRRIPSTSAHLTLPTRSSNSSTLSSIAGKRR